MKFFSICSFWYSAKNKKRPNIYWCSVCHIFFLIFFLPYPLSLRLPVSLSLMMGVFLFCGGCELSEFVSVSIIPSLWAPAYKSHEGPCALSHRPPVSGPSLFLYAHTATGKTVDKHAEKNRKSAVDVIFFFGHIQKETLEFRNKSLYF